MAIQILQILKDLISGLQVQIVPFACLSCFHSVFPLSLYLTGQFLKFNPEISWNPM
jgi:hypothetical protein